MTLYDVNDGKSFPLIRHNEGVKVNIPKSLKYARHEARLENPVIFLIANFCKLKTLLLWVQPPQERTAYPSL